MHRHRYSRLLESPAHKSKGTPNMRGGLHTNKGPLYLSLLVKEAWPLYLLVSVKEVWPKYLSVSVKEACL